MMVLQNKNEALSRKIQLIPLKDVHEGKAERVEIEGLRIAVTYINGSVYALVICAHMQIMPCQKDQYMPKT